MKTKTAKLLVGLMLAALILMIIFAVTSVHGESAATVWTDKSDYHPEETVTIYGYGFPSSTEIGISVTRPNLVVDSWTVISDSVGSFTTTYVLDGITGTYSVTATDGTTIATTTFTDSPDWTTSLFAWDEVQQKWVSGNLAGYYEGDLVGFKYVLTNKQAVTSAVPELTSFYDYFNTGVNALGIDAEVFWSYGYDDFTTKLPSGYTTVTPTIENAFYVYKGGVVRNYYQFAVDSFPDLAAGDTLYIFFQAHLAETAYWQTITASITWPPSGSVAGPHYGAASFPGASLQVGLALTYTGTSEQTQSIPVTAAFGSISGVKFNDLDGDGAPREAGEPGLGGWTITLYGTDTVGHTFTQTTTTAADGSYSFPALPLGTYDISETILSSAWIQTYPASLTYNDVPITSSDRAETGLDFGNFQPTSTTTTLLSAETITLGQSITDTATVTGNGPTPTGTVDFQVRLNGGSWTTFDAGVSLVSGEANSEPYYPLATGTYYFRAIYSGSAIYPASQSDDTAEPLTVNKADSTTETLLSKSEITLGESVTDSVTVTGLGNDFPVPSGTVDFYVMKSGGSWSKYDTETLDANGKATSIAYEPLTAGTYYFKAVYSGDDNYNGSESGATAEPLTVKPYTPKVETLLSASEITYGDSVTDTVTVTGLPDPFPSPTGDVEFYVSTDSGVTWTQFGATKTLVSGSATSDPYKPSDVGTYYFKAKYLGDPNYDPAESGDKEEPLKVNPVYILKQFTEVNVLPGSNCLSAEYVDPTHVNVYGLKSGPRVYFTVVYYFENTPNFLGDNYDGKAHNFTLWDKWGGNLMALGSAPTSFDPKKNSLTLADGSTFIIDPRLTGAGSYRGYIDSGLDISDLASQGEAFITMHLGDQQNGTNPGSGKGTSKDGTSYDTDITWYIGELAPGESATLTLYVAPGKNPGGQLEFTSLGCKVINTGPRVRAYGNTYNNEDFLYAVERTNTLTVSVEPPK